MESPEVWKWIILGIGVAFIALERAIKIAQSFSYRRNGRNRRKDGNNPHPCAAHGERLATIEQAIKDIRSDIKELKNLNNRR